MDDMNEAVRNAALHLDDVLTQSHRIKNLVRVDAAHLGLVLEALASTWPPKKKVNHDEQHPPEDYPEAPELKRWREVLAKRTLPEKLGWARVLLNIHGALSDTENEKVRRRIVKIAVKWKGIAS